MKVAYIDKPLPPAYLPIIREANRILETEKSRGFDITLRGLYYAFIAQDLLPASWIDAAYNLKNDLAADTKNTQKNYKRLGGIIADGRMAGLIDWNFLKDTGRQTDMPFFYDDFEEDSPGEILRDRANAYTLDPWSNSPYHIEVMVEKDAIEGYVAPVCREFGINFTSNRGYSSITTQRDSGLRLARAMQAGKEVVVLYVGDHDPSGIDMSRELEYKLNLFSGGEITLRRLALNMDQVEEYNPPPNPAKLTDSRAKNYIELYGDDSWEVEALNSQIISDIVREAIEGYVDDELRAEITANEEAYKSKMEDIANLVDDAMARRAEEEE